ncbi:carboxypeptidase regulatory-like domain-containing protein [Plantactinospora sp. S1510]|uniref:Carboxypeptidase regulatory-like domain-containing protein n=1 Tax=Plantactinospora alkalitolerans TaxID=2789879 RepID=A0ABS0GR96_9ACTN|nr:carboxypeptidase-like regulatory domain-containing protein [Plantactinospora alkalitolerans]MBF9128427.1 carboxypeptidase regulatory-like domain-containing protein [Plantactinospora alkalitolerans]
MTASPIAVGPNGTTTVRFSLNFQGGGESADVKAESNNSRLSCEDGCAVQSAEPGTFTAVFKRTSAALTGNQTATITVQATQNVVIGNGPSTSATVKVTLTGAPPPPEVQTVAEVSGRVTNETTGDPVSNASVRLKDGQGRDRTTNTSSSGSYKFTGSASSPIAPGQLEIKATKGGITDTRRVNASAGQRLNNQGIELAISASPSATPESTEDAVEEAPLEDGETEAPTESGAPAADNAANEDSGSGPWLLILAGGLLVALGVGAIVLLVMRRKEGNDDEDDDGVDAPRGGGPTGRGGGYRGGDDATRVATRGGADPTMVNRQSLADAPTMMHSSPLVEEFPDPYGAPLPGPQTPGYGGGQQGWGANGYDDRPGSGAGGYGNAPGSGAGYGNAPGSGAGYGNAPGSGAGYGAPVSGAAPGYGAPVSGAAPGYRDPADGYGEQFDEPTGRYTGRGDEDYGPAADPYETGAYRPSAGAAAGGYEPEQPYGQESGYDGGAYGGGRGYDEPRTGAGYDRADDGYGAANEAYETRADAYGQPGYEADRGGYEQPATGGGYDPQRAGYDAAGGYDERDYDQQQQGAGGYYDDSPRAGGGHSRSGAPQQPGRSERRSLDWLDD